jgi:regulator of protease activity HflC (stomatin/prohibitin superfamily)
MKRNWLISCWSAATRGVFSVPYHSGAKGEVPVVTTFESNAFVGPGAHFKLPWPFQQVISLTSASTP